jgi:hypothetical protein
MGRHVDIAALVHSADACSRDAAAAARLVRRSWPAGSDATQPAARDWIRRWGPARITADPPECGCAAGTCGWCN